MAAVFNVFIIFGSITAIVMFIISRQHTERLELIKRGMNPVKVAPPRTGSKSLFLGLVLVAIGLSLLISFVVNNKDSETLTGGLILLLGGVSFLAYWKMTAGDRERAVQAYEQHLENEKMKAEQAKAAPAEQADDPGTQE
ncbi:DUF6249 domain-containing protein [Candidatus Omnitrophota bacterium]